MLADGGDGSSMRARSPAGSAAMSPSTRRSAPGSCRSPAQRGPWQSVPTSALVTVGEPFAAASRSSRYAIRSGRWETSVRKWSQPAHGTAAGSRCLRRRRRRLVQVPQGRRPSRRCSGRARRPAARGLRARRGCRAGRTGHGGDLVDRGAAAVFADAVVAAGDVEAAVVEQLGEDVDGDTGISVPLGVGVPVGVGDDPVLVVSGAVGQQQRGQRGDPVAVRGRQRRDGQGAAAVAVGPAGGQQLQLAGRGVRELVADPLLLGADRLRG